MERYYDLVMVTILAENAIKEMLKELPGVAEKGASEKVRW